MQVHQVELDLQNEMLREVQFDLAEARDRYLDLFEFAPVAYLMLDAKQAIENANLTAAAMFGIDRPKLRGRKMAKLAARDCRDDCHRSIQQVLDSASRQVCELSFLRGDETFVGRMEIAPILSTYDQVVGARVTVTDVTVHKQAEDTLAEAKRAAEAANQAKSRFLAMMSHELRTPMGAILGMSELALAEPLSPAVREYLTTLRESADSLLGLLNDLLDLSRVEAGRLTLEAAPFSLRRVVGGVVDSLSAKAREKGLRLSCDFFGDVPDGVVGDSLRLRQILLNLVDNAIKFTSQGAVAVRVTAQSRSREDVRLQFSVSDTGVGIAPQRRKEIFNPFTQADASTTRRFGGSGLGLAIAANLVGLMDGRIWVESEPGQGSTFFFTVRPPLAREPMAEGGKGDSPHLPERPEGCFAQMGTVPLSAPARPLRILLAEDTRSSQQVIATILRKRGHTVALANDGQQALDLAGGQEFDAILMDVQMPMLDGYQATAAIRRREGEGLGASRQSAVGRGLGTSVPSGDSGQWAVGSPPPSALPLPFIPNPQSPRRTCRSSP